jgi:hypothetical protein
MIVLLSAHRCYILSNLFFPSPRFFSVPFACIHTPTSRDQPTSTTAHTSHQIGVRVLPPEDGQVMPETCRDFEP